MKTRQRTLERLESRHLMAGDWQNASLMRDVDNSALVTPIDVLLLINNLNSEGSRELPARSQHTGDPFYDVNGDNFLTPLDALIIINAINNFENRQPTVVGGLAPASDPNNNGVVLSGIVTINGQSLANSIVTVSLDASDSIPRSIVADTEGRFTVQLPIAEGLQTVRLSARDDLGRHSDKTLEVRRGNTIQDWNASALDIVRQWTTTSNDPYQGRIVTAQPPLVARNLAMIHAAMFDAANAVIGQYQAYRVNLPPQIGASAVRPPPLRHSKWPSPCILLWMKSQFGKRPSMKLWHKCRMGQQRVSVSNWDNALEKLFSPTESTMVPRIVQLMRLRQRWGNGDALSLTICRRCYHNGQASNHLRSREAMNFDRLRPQPSTALSMQRQSMK